MKPGEYFIVDGEIELNAGRDAIRVRVDNAGDRPIQVGSHTHFFEVNRFLRFDRSAAYGRRLDIPAGTALRQIDEAKRICRTCPAQARCLAWALDHGVTDGVWGGTTEDERRAVWRLTKILEIT